MGITYPEGGSSGGACDVSVFTQCIQLLYVLENEVKVHLVSVGGVLATHPHHPIVI